MVLLNRHVDILEALKIDLISKLPQVAHLVSYLVCSLVDFRCRSRVRGNEPHPVSAWHVAV